ncbi:glycosyltransferase family 39 protein [Uliginosibacterium sp. H3]|uniref:Glycosyltransferase family 39 protein n=1 Tax=Uliginosibacterium silvisoli TaxID=3114758 RepID=A0ABU6K9D7_9RHOO|nr:glycosyltransferase family 39 protein [Uliginosibacterium sp. H3]
MQTFATLRTPQTTGLPARSGAGMLLMWLGIVTFYRIWVLPRLGITLYVDEAQYWTWAQQLDWGYFSKPPVVAWLIAASTALFGDDLVAVKLSAILLYPATAWLLFVLGRQLFDTRVGLRSAVAFSLLPFVSGLGLFVSTDAPLLFFWALAILALVRATSMDRWRDWLLLGVALGLGVMSKYTMLAFGASALLYLLLSPQRRAQLGNPRLWAAIALAAVLVMPNVLWNWSHDFPTLRHTADITHVEGINDKGGNVGEFLLAQLASLGPGFALAFLAGLVVAWQQRRDGRMQLLVCFSLPLLAIVFLQALRSEANGNWAAPAFVTATVLAVVFLSRLKTRWWIVVIALNAGLMLTVYHVRDIYRIAGKPVPASLDILKRARAWDVLARQLRPIFAAHPDAMLLTENRTLMAHLLYELRDMHLQHAAWKPQAIPQDHYQLTTPLGPEDLGRSAILVTQSGSAGVIERFSSHQTLAHVSVIAGPKLRREVDVILLEGFRGYR